MMDKTKGRPTIMPYFRKNIEEMQGYTPGEQPKAEGLIKLNTNENPYPPSPKVAECLKSIDYDKLRLYPDPLSDELRDTIAGQYGFKKDNIIVGNGSDDILTIAVRSFVGEKEEIGCFEPTYSLYPVLAKIQNAEIVKIPLLEEDNFSFPDELLDKNSTLFQTIKNAKLFFIVRPNAPTGTAFEIEKIERFCNIFNGIVFIDEAYADFAEDNCINLVKKHPNVIIGRTMSKSYSLAGIRLGWAIASKEIIEGMMKVKDSYNVNYITQQLALAALQDQKYFQQTISKIKLTREKLCHDLANLGFKIIPSQANFVFVSPPNGNAKKLFSFLRQNKILARCFPGKATEKYIRITIGTDEEIEVLVKHCKRFISKKPFC